MNMQEARSALSKAGFEFHMKTGSVEHYWMDDIHVSIRPVLFYVDSDLCSLGGGLSDLTDIKKNNDYVVFRLKNRLNIELPIGGEK